MFKNKNEEEEEEEDPNASYNKKFYGDANKYDEDYYNNYIKQYQAQTMRCLKLFQYVKIFSQVTLESTLKNPPKGRVSLVELRWRKLRLAWRR